MNKEKRTRLSARTTTLPAPSHNKSTMDFGLSGACADLSEISDDFQPSLEDRDSAVTMVVLRTTLRMLNYIGARLTMDSSDLYSAFSHSFDPTPVYANSTIVLLKCTRPDGCTNCDDVLALVNKIETLTRKLCNSVARPLFSVPSASTNDASLDLCKELRYNQDIVCSPSVPKLGTTLARS